MTRTPRNNSLSVSTRDASAKKDKSTYHICKTIATLFNKQESKNHSCTITKTTHADLTAFQHLLHGMFPIPFSLLSHSSKQSSMYNVSPKLILASSVYLTKPILTKRYTLYSQCNKIFKKKTRKQSSTDFTSHFSDPWTLSFTPSRPPSLFLHFYLSLSLFFLLITSVSLSHTHTHTHTHTRKGTNMHACACIHTQTHTYA